MNTGRNLVKEPSSTASRIVRPCSRSWLKYVTSTRPLSTATPLRAMQPTAAVMLAAAEKLARRVVQFHQRTEVSGVIKVELLDVLGEALLVVLRRHLDPQVVSRVLLEVEEVLDDLRARAGEPAAIDLTLGAGAPEAP